MIVLSVDTTTSLGSIAIGQVVDEKMELLGQLSWKRQGSHAELLTPQIEWLLSSLKISAKDIDRYVVDIGPGSFTGIRVGLNCVKTMAYSFNKPILPLHSLEIMAYPINDKSKKLITLLNAQKNEVYFSVFESSKTGWKVLKSPQVSELTRLSRSLKGSYQCIGEGYEAHKPELKKLFSNRLLKQNDLYDYPLSSCALYLSQSKRFLKKWIFWKELEALYIKNSAAEEKLQKGLLKPMTEL